MPHARHPRFVVVCTGTTRRVPGPTGTGKCGRTCSSAMARRRQPRAWARARASRSVCGRRTAAAAATRLQTPVGGLTAHLRRRLRRATRGLRSAARQVRAAVASGRAGPRSLARRPGAAAEKEKGGGRTTVTRVEVGGKGISAWGRPYALLHASSPLPPEAWRTPSRVGLQRLAVGIGSRMPSLHLTRVLGRGGCSTAKIGGPLLSNTVRHLQCKFLRGGPTTSLKNRPSVACGAPQAFYGLFRVRTPRAANGGSELPTQVGRRVERVVLRKCTAHRRAAAGDDGEREQEYRSRPA